MKYFLLGAFASAFFIYGMALCSMARRVRSLYGTHRGRRSFTDGFEPAPF